MSEGKYAGLRKANGEALPDGEPYWVFRARDAFAVPAIETYRVIVAAAGLPPEFIAEVDAHIERIRDYQAVHGSKRPT
jgi:hypothetical protein